MANIDKFDAIASAYDTPERVKVARALAGAIRRVILDAGTSGSAGTSTGTSTGASAPAFAATATTTIAQTRTKTAIDYGCGTGLVGLCLLDLFKRILFLDAAPNMVEQVNNKLRETGAANADAQCRDFMVERPEDIRADYLILVQVLLHERDTETLLSRLYPVLNPGGHLIIVDFVKNEQVISDKVHNGFDPEVLTGLLRRLSFQDSSYEICYQGEKLFMNQDASLFLLDAVK